VLVRSEIEQLSLVQLENGAAPPPDFFDHTSYNLRLGSEYCLIRGSENEQQVGDCSQGIGVLKIPPFACALVSTDEIVQLPRDIYGRWGLKIRPAMSGLVFQAGPQIEPGSHGRLFGLLFNLSSSDRVVHYRTPLWSIDFERLPAPLPTPPVLPAPILRMREYTQLGLPTGSLNEIYSDYRRLQRDIASRRELGIGVMLALVTLIASISLPLVVSKIESGRDQQQEIMEQRLQDLEQRLEGSNGAPPPAPPAAKTP
jgi:hypothetical protein